MRCNRRLFPRQRSSVVRPDYVTVHAVTGDAFDLLSTAAFAEQIRLDESLCVPGRDFVYKPFVAVELRDMLNSLMRDCRDPTRPALCCNCRDRFSRHVSVNHPKLKRQAQLDTCSARRIGRNVQAAAMQVVGQLRVSVAAEAAGHLRGAWNKSGFRHLAQCASAAIPTPLSCIWTTTSSPS